MRPSPESDEPDQRAVDEVYRRRARQLAERPADRTDTATTTAVLVFTLGTERYGIALTDLAEVLLYRGCTAVPGTPAALLGVINVRGDIRPVADLRGVLELAAADASAGGYVVMLRQQGGVGLKVDTIDQVCQVDHARMLSARDGVSLIPGARFVKALTADGVILIDIGAVLSGLGLAPT
ncbi:MAG: chemotaxis protein CheW [Vicinamibacterales bacterium]